MDRADPRTGEHRHSGFGDHRHIYGDAVAFADPARFHHIGKFADFFMQLAIGDMAAVGGLITFKDDGCLVTALGQMPVKAVGGGVECAVFKPFDAQIISIIRDVFNFAVRLDPVDPFAVFGPETFIIGDRALIHVLIGGIIDKCMSRSFSAWRK